jgi:hypothetical protein
LLRFAPDLDGRFADGAAQFATRQIVWGIELMQRILSFVLFNKPCIEATPFIADFYGCSAKAKRKIKKDILFIQILQLTRARYTQLQSLLALIQIWYNVKYRRIILIMPNVQASL